MTNILSKIGIVLAGALLAVASYGMISATVVDAKGKPGADNGTIVDIAIDNGFTSLAAALQCVDLVETFDGNRQFTVFAPTNAAFTNALNTLGLTFEELCNDKVTLKNILAYHVTPGVKTSQTVSNRSSMNMLNRQMASISSVPKSIEAPLGLEIDDAGIAAVDIRATNGVVHVLNDVMLP